MLTEYVPSAAALIKSAATLAPILLDRAERTERDRQIGADIVQRMKDEDLFRIFVPKRFGGFEHDFVVMARVIAELGKGCGSTAWVYGVTAMHSWVAATFPLETQEEVWADGPQAVISGSYAPNPKLQTAALADGGYRLSGRWGFASGCDHADWHLLQALLPVAGADARVPHFILVPRADFTIDDDWHVMGMAGTGSKTVVLEDVFVPQHRALDYRRMNAGDTPGGAAHANPVYRMPFMSVIPLSISSPVLGIIDTALGAVVASGSAGGRDSAVRGKFAEHTMAHCWIGEASASVDAARLVIFSALETLADIARAGERPTTEQRVRLRRDYAFGVRLCVQAAQVLLNCSGASGAMLASPSQRAWRDVNAAARHLGLNWEPFAIQAGRQALGLEPKGLH